MTRLHVVFDLDDTLYPEREYASAGFKSAGRWARDRFGVDGLADEMTHMLDNGMLGKLFATVLGRHVPDHSPEDLRAFHEAYRRAEDPELSLFEDAAKALDRYERAGPIGLITDGTHYVQARKVKALQLEPRFARIVFTDELGDNRAFFKPHPKPYEIMAAALGSAGDRYVYIGDNPAKDFVSPNAMGWTSVLVHRPHPRIHDVNKVAPGGEPQYTITTLDDLPEIIGY
ncbi:MAG: HAD family hydrolase [Hyphomicrobiaceae bacterium]